MATRIRLAGQPGRRILGLAILGVAALLSGCDEDAEQARSDELERQLDQDIARLDAMNKALSAPPVQPHGVSPHGSGGATAGGHAGSSSQPRSQWSDDPRQRLIDEHGADKVVTVVVSQIIGNQEDAGEYIRRKLFKAAQYDRQQDIKNAQEQTRRNEEAARQQAIQEGQFIYRYQRGQTTLGNTTIHVLSKADGTWTFAVAPVLSIDRLSQRLQVGQVTGIDQATRTLHIQSTVPDPAPDFDVEEMIATHGADKIATLWVTGAAGDEDRVRHYLERQAAALDPARNLYVAGPKLIRPGDYRVTVAPVDDFEALVGRIRFGTIDASDAAAREVLVVAQLPADLPTPPRHGEWYSDWDEQPKPGEDQYDWALRIIKAQISHSGEKAYKFLLSVEPDPAQLERVSEVLVAVLPRASSFTLDQHLDAMLHWRTDEGIQAIMDRLDESSAPWDVEKYVKVLAKMGTPEAARALIKMLSDRQKGEKAANALMTMGQVAEDPVLELLDNPSAQVRAGACNLLWAVGTEKSVTTLRERMRRERERQVKTAMKNAIDAIERRLRAKAEDE